MKIHMWYIIAGIFTLQLRWLVRIYLHKFLKNSKYLLGKDIGKYDFYKFSEYCDTFLQKRLNLTQTEVCIHNVSNFFRALGCTRSSMPFVHCFFLLLQLVLLTIFVQR